MKKIRIIVLFSLLLIGFSFASDSVWVCNNGGDFNNPHCWQSSSVPSDGNIIINATGTYDVNITQSVQLNGNVYLGSDGGMPTLLIVKGATVSINTITALSGTVSVDGKLSCDLTINSTNSVSLRNVIIASNAIRSINHINGNLVFEEKTTVNVSFAVRSGSVAFNGPTKAFANFSAPLVLVNEDLTIFREVHFEWVKLYAGHFAMSGASTIQTLNVDSPADSTEEPVIYGLGLLVNNLHFNSGNRLFCSGVIFLNITTNQINTYLTSMAASIQIYEIHSTAANGFIYINAQKILMQSPIKISNGNTLSINATDLLPSDITIMDGCNFVTNVFDGVYSPNIIGNGKLTITGNGKLFPTLVSFSIKELDIKNGNVTIYTAVMKDDPNGMSTQIISLHGSSTLTIIPDAFPFNGSLTVSDQSKFVITQSATINKDFAVTSIQAVLVLSVDNTLVVNGHAQLDGALILQTSVSPYDTYTQLIKTNSYVGKFTNTKWSVDAPAGITELQYKEDGVYLSFITEKHDDKNHKKVKWWIIVVIVSVVSAILLGVIQVVRTRYRRSHYQYAPLNHRSMIIGQ